MTLRCFSCHSAHHRGLLEITGEAPDHIVTTRVNAPPRSAHVSAASRSSDLIATKRGESLPPDDIAVSKRGATNTPRAMHVIEEGESPDVLVTKKRTNTANPTPGAHVANEEPTRRRFEDAAMRVQARDALVGLGWKIGIASSAVEEARAHVGATATLEAWIREALRRCPLPRA